MPIPLVRFQTPAPTPLSWASTSSLASIEPIDLEHKRNCRYLPADDFARQTSSAFKEPRTHTSHLGAPTAPHDDRHTKQGYRRAGDIPARQCHPVDPPEPDEGDS
jgi:hypothetical protein